MKRKSPLVLAIFLGTLTVALQLPQSLAQGRDAASAYRAGLAAHGGALTPQDARRVTRIRRPIRKAVRPSLLPTAVAAAPALQFAAPVPLRPVLAAAITQPTDALAALVKPDITVHHQELARAVLSAAPVGCQSRLQNFYVIYDNPGHRGVAGRGTAAINGALDDRGFIKQLVHEVFGHVCDLTYLDGSPAAGPSGFRDGAEVIYADDPSVKLYRFSWDAERTRRTDSRDEDFVSAYARTDAFEDAAETITYYFLNEDAFRARAAENPVLAAKLQWVESHFPKTQAIATGGSWNGRIPHAAADGEYAMQVPAR